MIQSDFFRQISAKAECEVRRTSLVLVNGTNLYFLFLCPSRHHEEYFQLIKPQVKLVSFILVNVRDRHFWLLIIILKIPSLPNFSQALYLDFYISTDPNCFRPPNTRTELLDSVYKQNTAIIYIFFSGLDKFSLTLTEYLLNVQFIFYFYEKPSCHCEFLSIFVKRKVCVNMHSVIATVLDAQSFLKVFSPSSSFSKLQELVSVI